MRREYPDLVTREPAPDDEDVELKDSHSTQGRDLEWLAEKECLLTVELSLLEEHEMTLPPEKRPLRGFDRDGQTNWRGTALYDARRKREPPHPRYKLSRPGNSDHRSCYAQNRFAHLGTVAKLLSVRAFGAGRSVVRSSGKLILSQPA